MYMPHSQSPLMIHSIGPRCGIVLCSRDAKFAVECDTCKMPYCLVCLASGTKDPCVRCGQRPSKRVEQLVHLRLKSIYKAFKQSGAALNRKGGKSSINCSSDGRKSDSSDAGEHGQNRHIDVSDQHISHWMAKKPGSSSASMPLPASVQRYAELHGKDSMKRAANGDVGDMLQVAAATAASAAMSSSSDGNPRSRRGGNDFFSECSKIGESDSINEHRNKSRVSNDSDKFASRTEAEADAAAAALLAELDEEKLQHEANTKAKKSKKKKKKQRQAAKEKEKEEHRLKEEESKKANAQSQKKKSIPDTDTSNITDSVHIEDCKKLLLNKSLSNKKKDAKEKQTLPLSDCPESKKFSQADESDDDDIALLSDKKNIKNESKIDEIERSLADLVSSGDLEGIEKLLTKMKGVPGRAALRKNAKKAVKRIKEERAASAVKQVQTQTHTHVENAHSAEVGGTGADNRGYFGYRAPEPLLKVVSKNNRVTTPGQTPRYECVMHMAPSVVGWVIGKGGQRIRDLMEDSGAKVWIDQDSMGPNDMRVVYVSGNKKSIDSAVTMVKDLVAKAPVGGTTHSTGVPTSVHSMNDTSSVTSTRSSLTSTPVSIVQNFTQQVPPMAEKPSFSPTKKTEHTHEEHRLPKASKETLSSKPNPSLATNPTISKVPVDQLPPAQMPLPPGILSGVDLAMPNSSHMNLKEEEPKPTRAVHELTCEPRFVALLIGRRGWTVKQIQDTSGARVDIDQTVNPRRIIISGEVDQVQHAVNLVRGVLSYPHAKQHYSTAVDIGESDNGAFMGASNGVSEDFLASISPIGDTIPNGPFANFSISNDKQVPGNHNHADPTLLQNTLNQFSLNPADMMQHQQFNSQIGTDTLQKQSGQMQHQTSNAGLGMDDMLYRSSAQGSSPEMMQHQQFNARIGMEMFHRSNNRDAIPDKLQHQQFNGGLGMSASSNIASSQEVHNQSGITSISAYTIERHHATSTHVENPNINAPSTTHHYLYPQMQADNFQYESVLPLSGNTTTRGGKVPLGGSHLQGIEETVADGSMVGGQRHPSYNFEDQTTSNHKENFSAMTEQVTVNSMFDNKVDDSLINSLNDFSFLDFSPNDGGDEKPTEKRSFGLGGVRLDSTDDSKAKKEGLPSLNQYDGPIWGPGP